MKVLVAEDDSLIQFLLQRWLNREGYNVLVATDGAKAVEMARDERPDLILMDIGMPVLDGVQALTCLKMIPETRTIPVIAVTSYVMPDERERYHATGFDEVESKPIEFQHLLSKMQHLLHQSWAVGQ